jgi:hypothetical protein
LRSIPILAALLALALSAPPALAQAGSPFAPLPPAQTTPAPAPSPSPTPSTPSSNPNDQQVSTLGVLGLFVAGILVILAIGYFIMRDARRSLPRSKRRRKAAPQPGPAPAGSKRPPPRRPSANQRKRRKRQKRRTR